MNFTETQAAQAIMTVLPDSRWIGAGLSQAYLWANANERSYDDIARHLYDL